MWLGLLEDAYFVVTINLVKEMFIASFTCSYYTMGGNLHGFYRWFSKNMGCHDYLFMLDVRIRRICILTPCKNGMKRQDETNMFFEKAKVCFGIQSNIILYKGT